MINYTKRFAGAAAWLSLLIFGFSFPGDANAQSAEYVIFEVNGSAPGLSEKFVLGSVLKDGDRIELPESSEIRLLDKAGDIVILTGPLVGTVLNEDGDSQESRDGSNALKIIAKLMFGKRSLVNNLGAARTVENNPVVIAKKQAWVPVIFKPGTYCLPLDAPVFSRASSKKRAKITVMADGGIFVEKTWNKDENSISISDVVKKSVESYTLFISFHSTESSLHLLDRSGMSSTRQLAWMVERGCDTQAVQLLKELSEEAG
ncbi:MAG: hypothetical protein L3J32_04630 [Rhizobiaceae bacterium]|nr:hypothetical protein [Rhizobiaceae bacterium]